MSIGFEFLGYVQVLLPFFQGLRAATCYALFLIGTAAAFIAAVDRLLPLVAACAFVFFASTDRQLFPIVTGITVALFIVSHILCSADGVLVFLALGSFVVGWLDEGLLTIR